MKKTLMSLLLIFCVLYTQRSFSQENDLVLLKGQVEKDDTLKDRVFTEVIKAKKRSTQATTAIVKINGEPVDTSAKPLRKLQLPVNTYNKTAQYRLGEDMIISLPVAEFSMKDSILRDRKGKKIECLILDIEQKQVKQADKLVFGQDSLTTNTISTYRLIKEFSLNEEGVEWRKKGRFLFPAISTDAVDYNDKPNNYVYGVAVKTDDGVIHTPLWTEVEEFWTKVKLRVYTTDVHEGKRFTRKGDDFFFDDKPIKSLVVMRDNF